ncbi:MAG: hypothetical protein ABI589_03590 [Burkholderiales bacterium]
MNQCAASLVIAGWLALAGPASAATYRVDDSGTVANVAVVKMKWRHLVPGRGSDNTVDGQLQVALRLNLQPWLNRPVRLYMGLANTRGEPVEATWRTQGRLLPGTVRSGSRTLVFDGIVGGSVLEETIEIALSTDGRALVSTETLQFYFEVDTP